MSVEERNEQLNDEEMNSSVQTKIQKYVYSIDEVQSVTIKIG